MALVTFHETPVQEVDFGEPELVQHQLLRAMDANLTGFVLRQLSNDHEEAAALLQAAVAPRVRLGRQVAHFDFSTAAVKGADLGLHIDIHGTRPRIAQINLYTMIDGVVDVRLFALQATALQSFRSSNQSPLDDAKVLHYLRENVVDDTLLIPFAHTVHLTPGDNLIFSDSRNAHDFRSGTMPRRSKAGLYHPRRTVRAHLAGLIQSRAERLSD